MLKGLVAWWARNPVAGNLLMLFCVARGRFVFLQDGEGILSRRA